MGQFYITCIDKIGLTFDEKFHQINFEIPQMYSDEKIKILCVNKYNELYSPKYPYFYVNIKDIIHCIHANITIIKNNITVELVNKDIIFKLKFIGLCKNPVYYFCSGKKTFRQILKKLCIKYPLCHNGLFKYNDYELKIDLYIKDCNYQLDTINEIYRSEGKFTNFLFSV